MLFCAAVAAAEGVFTDAWLLQFVLLLLLQKACSQMHDCCSLCCCCCCRRRVHRCMTAAVCAAVAAAEGVFTDAWLLQFVVIYIILCEA
jgi:tellurite resistance protein